MPRNIGPEIRGNHNINKLVPATAATLSCSALLQVITSHSTKDHPRRYLCSHSGPLSFLAQPNLVISLSLKAQAGSELD